MTTSKTTGHGNTYVEVYNGISGSNIRDERQAYSINDHDPCVVWRTIMIDRRKRRSINNEIYMFFTDDTWFEYKRTRSSMAWTYAITLCGCTQQPPREAIPRSNWKIFYTFKHVSNVVMSTVVRLVRRKMTRLRFFTGQCGFFRTLNVTTRLYARS